jgi:hypothetical protein
VPEAYAAGYKDVAPAGADWFSLFLRIIFVFTVRVNYVCVKMPLPLYLPLPPVPEALEGLPLNSNVQYSGSSRRS